MVLRVGILGASGIGYIHARHYHELGARIVALLCSTQSKANSVAKKLQEDFNIEVEPFDNIDNFLKKDIDAVSICTPPSLHINNIHSCFDKNIPVFCEKPIFWNSSMDQNYLSSQLHRIESHENRGIFVNTSNTVFIDSIIRKKNKSATWEKLSFEFFTNGDHTGIGIAQDLLPHGLSLLIHLLGDCEITDFTSNFTHHTFSCKFRYGKCFVNFEFKEHPSSPRHMRIGLNGNTYTRVQVGSGSNYKVSLINDSTKEVIPVKDPFRVYISRFLNFVDSGSGKENDSFHVGALNLNLMAKCLCL